MGAPVLNNSDFGLWIADFVNFGIAMCLVRKTICLCVIIYLLLLCWQPCQDVANNSTSHLKHFAEQFDLHETQTENEGDDCSPFCICSCCQTSFAYNDFHLPQTNQISSLISAKLARIYQNPYINIPQNSIWQPPKSQA